MIHVTRPLARAATFALLLGTLAVPAYAAPVDNTTPSGPPNSTVNLNSNGSVVNTTPDTSGMVAPNNANAPGVASPAMVGQAAPYAQPDQTSSGAAPAHHHWAKGDHPHGPADMQAHVEERIKTLHAKLKITPDQESQWNDVAQAMRDNESQMSSLIQERHSETNKTAIDDMDSYGQIAQAHADGIKKVEAAFKPLYDSMSDAQKKNADNVFGEFEGKGPAGHHHHHVTK